MDFGSSHIFTEVGSDTEEITAADFQAQYGVYQPLGSTLSMPAARIPGNAVSQSEDTSSMSSDDPLFEGDTHEYHVLYDNFVGDPKGTRGGGGAGGEPIYDNRSLQKASTKSSDYAKPYDLLNRQSHPYDYAGPGTAMGNAPPPLPPDRKKEIDPMDEPIYEGLSEGEYQALLLKHGSSKIRRADTNIVAVKFDTLVQAENTVTGSPVFCGSNCGAAMSHLSKISQMYSGKCWVCEFCEFENPVGDDVTVPTTEDSTYVMGTRSGGGADTLVIFCVDVSGSMAVTTEVSGEVAMQGRRTDEQVALEAYQEELDAAEQRRRAAQQEAIHAEMLASYEGTIEHQAQALAQFQISRTASTASTAPAMSSQPQMNPGQVVPTAPPGTLPPAYRASAPPGTLPPPSINLPTRQPSAMASTPPNYAPPPPLAPPTRQPSSIVPAAPNYAPPPPLAPPTATPSRQPSAIAAATAQAERQKEMEERYVAAPTRASQKIVAPPRPADPPTRRPAPEPPQPTKHVSYISRLQSMQSAIQQQVDKLQAENSPKRVGLVAFNNNVTVIGDGSLDSFPLEGAGLTDRESLISLGQNFPPPGPIAEVHRCLTEKIYSLTESGQTALGPALLIAISMAAQKPGSKVIMCTDGMANVGLGALHDMDNDAAYEAAAAFYDEVGNFARDSGVCVSVLTLEGEDCRAIELGSVADKTRGQVSIVKPNDLHQQFADILADPILATNVSAKMVLHKGLYLRDESDNPESMATHNVGLVTADSETTFEFGVRKKEVLYDNFGGTTVEQRVEDEPIYDSVSQTMIEGLEKLPFQVQIRYTGRDGLDYQRILTMDRPVTKDRKFAEQNANVGVIGAHAAQSAAKLAVEGAYAKAQINAIITQKLVQRCTQPVEGETEQEGIYQTFLANMAPINSEITRAHQQEWDSGEYMELERISESRDDDDDEEEEDVQLISKNKKISKKMKMRRKNVSDRQASVFYRMKGATTKMFNKQTYNMAEVV